MKRLLPGGIIISLVLAVFNYAYANLGFKTNTPQPVPEQGAPQPIPQQALVPMSRIDVEGSGSITIQFRDITLGNVLQSLADETGIQFQTPGYMASLPFSTDIRAENWKDAVRKLLNDYSTVEVWTDKPETSRVWVLSSNPYVSKSTESPRPTRVNYKAPQPATVLQPTQPVMSQNDQSISISMLPPHILMEPGVLSYLQSKGVELPQDIKAMYGPMLEGLPKGLPISPHILHDPMFLGYLNSMGLETPAG